MLSKLLHFHKDTSHLQEVDAQHPSYQHLWDHVIWDFISPELFGNKTVTVAL